MDSRVFPPTDGSVTLPETVDFHWKHNPNHSVYVFSEDGKPERTKITALEFGRATDRVAHHVRPGRTGLEGEVIAFVALSDTLLYQAVTIGIMRAGLVPYPMSPRNTAAAVIKLMKDTACHRLITTRETLRPLIDEITAEVSKEETPYSLSIEEVPPLAEIFPNLGIETAEDPFEPYPTAPRPPLDDVMLYLHSSGSTGWPKTVKQTFRSMVHWASFAPIADNRNYRPLLTLGAMALPPFHTLGLAVQTLVGLYSMVPIGLYPPIATTPHSMPMIPTPGNILDHLVRSGCNCLIIIPALLQIWSQDKKAIDILSQLEYAAYSGGAVPSKLGNLLTENGVTLIAIYGATEFGALSHFIRKEGDKNDWEYMDLTSDLVNIRWDPQGDGTYECQLIRTETHHTSIENLPDVRGYATSDLWVPHHTKPHLWKIVGRRDDVIVHTSGEKTVPAPMEDIIMSSPYIMGTVMFGRDYDQTGVLIELKPAYAVDPSNERDLITVRNTLWPIIEEANKVAPAFSRIFKEMILVTSPSKPLPRAGKGTVMRKAALTAYQAEIEEIYAKVEATAKVEAVVPPASWVAKNVMAWLKAQIEEIHSAHTFSVSGDLFEQGMDSLSATILRRRIVGAMQSKEAQKAAQLVSQTTIYSHPTIERLSEFLVGIVADPDNFVLSASRSDAIDAMITKYTSGLSQPIDLNKLAVPPADAAVVLLTGSTGNLGAQLLESLLQDPKVKTVYTLDRPATSSSIASRQALRFADKGLDATVLNSPRLVLLEGETSHKNLGLKSAVYEKLRNSVTTIIHNAWRLDFNLGLASFEPNIQGTRNLIDLARSSPYGSSVKILFTSSISSTFSWDKTQGPYPEEVVEDPRYAVGNGYGESKYVSERILAQSGVQTAVFRIGQISGGLPNGAWATTDWVPILVKSSVRLGALPEAVGFSSWVPMHSVAQTILDIALSEKPTSPALNIVHPRPVTWNSVMGSINDALVQEGVIPNKLPIVDFTTWFSHLESHSRSSLEDVLKEIPAIKLLDFFRGIVQMDQGIRTQGLEDVEVGGLASLSTDKIQSISQTMKDLPPISHSDASLWISYWKNSRFL
ncbi:acetyl-CoA synthetase-like protein [Gymnopilus junonius]|uniref:Acetyl-CoA synthetase-like protein n=1 Tax=Gymnopilus junonius TaxID=109634 RepID=A0A9P5NPZ2_GYMJU|nr:acetyl-CoA synthetase-like protein [Gymnopilus junonius]